MFNPLNFISKFIKSGNKKELDRIDKIVDQINLLEKNIKKLSNKEFPEKTVKLKEEIQKGTSLDKILPEAFALVREASLRSRSERHFDFHLLDSHVFICSI